MIRGEKRCIPSACLRDNNWVCLSDREISCIINSLKMTSPSEEHIMSKLLDSRHKVHTSPCYDEKDILDLFMFSKLFGRMVSECNIVDNDFGIIRRKSSRHYSLNISFEPYDLDFYLYKRSIPNRGDDSE